MELLFCFQVYRLKLTAWSDCKRTLFHQEDRNGMEGEFNCCQYQPRERVINGMKDDLKETMAQEAEDMFKDFM